MDILPVAVKYQQKSECILTWDDFMYRSKKYEVRGKKLRLLKTIRHTISLKNSFKQAPNDPQLQPP